MVRRVGVLGAFVGISAILGSVANGAAFDLRECPLDKLTFVDPWVGDSFKVDRVGIDYTYRCGDEYVDEPIEGQACVQFGRTALEGDLRDADGVEKYHMLSIWYVETANPCCGWVQEWLTPESVAAYDWVEGADVPLLGQMPFASIEAGGTLTLKSGLLVSFGNEKHAMVCALD